MKKFAWTVLLVLLTLSPLMAQQEGLAPVTGTVAVTNVNVVPAPGELIQEGTVLIEDGLIKAVGKNVAIPAGARIINADSLYLYSGFVLGMSHAGISMPKQEDQPKVKDPGNPPNDRAGITPERRVYQFFDPSHKSIEEWREAGFTVAQTSAEGGMLPGTASVILLNGKGQDESILRSETGIFSTFDGAQRMYPATVLGVMAHYRQLYRRAVQEMEFTASFENDPSGRKRPTHDVVLQALYPVAEGKIPMIFKTEEILEAQRAILLKEELGFNLTLAELKQGWDLREKIKKNGVHVQFSLDLPEWDEKEKDSAKDAKFSEERRSLELRKEEALKKYYGQMAEFAAAGIPFGFSGLEVKPGEVQKKLQKIVEQGLSHSDALAALTTNPAAMLGIEKIAGTVEKGKLANLLITTKPYFEKESKVKFVVVDGELFEYDLTESKKADPESAKRVVGEWTYESQTPSGPMTGLLVIKEEDEVLSGTITNTITSEESNLNDIVVSEDMLSFNFDVVFQGQPLNVEATVKVSGSTFEGSLSGGGESFPIEGSKNPE